MAIRADACVAPATNRGRRNFLRSTTASAAALLLAPLRPLMDRTAYGGESDDDARRARIEGLLVGSLIGDAAGGPLEFKTRQELAEFDTPLKVWADDERLTPELLHQHGAAFRLLPYDELRPDPAPYGQWTERAPAGTLTDDTRMKIFVVRAIRRAYDEGRSVTARDVASELIAFGQDTRLLARPGYAKLCGEWLEQWSPAAHWLLGEREPGKAFPPERLWAGMGTVAGQMALLPLAAAMPGDPQAAYESAYRVGFFDNGPAKDINSAIVAGLSAALAAKIDTGEESPPHGWQALERAVRDVDPYRYSSIPWVERPAVRWLDFALDAADRADRCPARLFAILENELGARTWWEAHATYASAFAIARLCDYHPLASLQLALELGHDTDSTAQLLGALVGAVYGAVAFPAEMRELVTARLAADYDEQLEDWVDLLMAVAGESSTSHD